MKKSIVLCVIASLALGSSVSAANIKAQVKLRHVDVSVTDIDNVSIPTLQLLNSDKTKMLYTGEGTAENNEYIFDGFSFPMNAESGEYVLRVGENGKISETVIKYTAYDEALQALQSMANDKNTISDRISAYPELFGTTASEYDFLDSDWKKRLENDIAKIEIKYADENEATETIEKISETVKRTVNWATLTGSGDEKKIENAIKSVSGLDTTYIGKFSSLSKLKEAFAAQNIDKINIDESGILSAFDGAVLVTVVNECDWGTGKEALNYYAKKGLVSIDSKYLSGSADVYKALKEKKILDYKQLPNALKSAYESIYSGSGGSTGGGSGSGGSGGSSGGKQTGQVNSVNIVPTQTSTENTQMFNDLEDVQWAKTAIEALAAKKIVSGRGNGSFAPNETMTRAEFVKIIVEAFGLKDNTAVIDFDDVKKEDWSYSYIASAKRAGIIYGITDKYFGAEETVSRQDMAVIMLRVAELKNIDTSGNGTVFADSETISDYAREAVGRLTASGILNGMGDGTFSPLTEVTRAQGAQVVYTMLCRKG